MPTFLLCQTDDDNRLVEGADAYAPEGSLTTFFATRDGRGVIDSWATRIASFKTAQIASIERVLDREAATSAEPIYESVHGFLQESIVQGTYEPVSASAQNAIDSAPPMAYTAGSTRSRDSSANAAAMARGNALVA